MKKLALLLFVLITFGTVSLLAESLLKATKFPCNGDKIKITITSEKECKKLCRKLEKYHSGSGYYYRDYCFDEENEECYCR